MTTAIRTGRALLNFSRNTVIKTLPTKFARSIRIAAALTVLAPGLSGCILGSERPELNLEVPAGPIAKRPAARRTRPFLPWTGGAAFVPVS